MSTISQIVRQGRRYAPQKLRSKLILMAVLMVSIPTLAIGYFVEEQGRTALIHEKQAKLFAAARLLNQQLQDEFSLDATLPRAARIKALNQRLSPITERVAAAFPGIGVGYYHRQLDAIITYAPSSLYQSNVGRTIASDHPGRQVMLSQHPEVVSGKQVRGNIMNAMLPIARDGQTLGYIWANELTEDISQQALAMDLRVIAVLALGLLLSLPLIVLLSRRFSASIDVIKQGLAGLPQNLHVRLPDLAGEMGEISRSVNELALALREALSAREEILRNMAHAERMAALGELMAGVAHEVRNPLTAIKGYAQILKELNADPQHQEYLRVILKEIQSINCVIQQLLDFARPHAGRWQPISLNRLLQDCLVLIKTKGVEARITFVSELAPDLPEIEADGEMLRQVLLNLLINAVQAIPSMGTIHISTARHAAGEQCVTIQDDGCGISDDIKDKIFAPFFTTKASGTGLGLAISQRIIAAHHGDISLVSAVNQGTTFTLLLPKTQKETNHETELANPDR